MARGILKDLELIGTKKKFRELTILNVKNRKSAKPIAIKTSLTVLVGVMMMSTVLQNAIVFTPAA